MESQMKNMKKTTCLIENKLIGHMADHYLEWIEGQLTFDLSSYVDDLRDFCSVQLEAMEMPSELYQYAKDSVKRASAEMLVALAVGSPDFTEEFVLELLREEWDGRCDRIVYDDKPVRNSYEDEEPKVKATKVGAKRIPSTAKVTIEIDEFEAHACAPRYEHLLRCLGGPSIDHDAPINLLTILEYNGVDDCLWALRATDAKPRIFRRAK